MTASPVSHRPLGIAAALAGVPSRALRRTTAAKTLLACTVALASTALLFSATTAQAARVFSSFGSPGSEAGQLQSPAGVAVDNSTGPAAGDVYVADTGNARVDQFDANGNFIRAWGWGVAGGVGFEVCTKASLGGCKAGISGSGAGQFVAPSYIAVDSSAGPSAGDIYVADPGDDLVSKFTPGGALVTGWGNNGGGEIPNGQLAGPPEAKGTGTLTAESRTIELTATETGAFLPGQEITGAGIYPNTEIVTVNGPVVEISQSVEPEKSGIGVALSAHQSGFIAGITLDSAANLLIAHAGSGGGTQVLKYTQAGAFVDSFRTGDPTASGAIAVRPTGDILISGGGGVTELSSSGAELKENVVPAPTTGLAVDSAEGSLYVDNGTELARYDSSGSLVESFGAGDLTGATGIAVNFTTNGGVYAADTSAGRVDLFLSFGPFTSTSAPTELTGTSATLQGRVSPTSGGAITDCHFEYVEDAGYDTSATNPYAAGQSVPCTPGAPISSSTPVSAPLTGLNPGGTYHFRVVATDANATTSSADRTFLTPGPSVSLPSVSNVAATSATLEASINPQGAATTYYFQYGPSVAYGETIPALTAEDPAGAPVGSGSEDVAVQQHPQSGLVAGTLYHYRVVAVSEPSPGVRYVDEGSDKTFTTQSAAPFALADGRQWELVSPPDKHGGQLEGNNHKTEEKSQAAAGGGAVTYLAAGPTEPLPAGFQEQMQVFSTRTPSGWVTKDIEIPHYEATEAATQGKEYRIFSSDLSTAILQPFGGFNPALSSEASEQTAYLRSDFAPGNLPCTESCYRPVVTAASGYANVPSGTHFGTTGECESGPTLDYSAVECGPDYVGASPDLKHVIIASEVALTPEVPAETPSEAPYRWLYEWQAGALKLVSVLPSAEGGTPVKGILGSSAQPTSYQGWTTRAVSSDGTSVVWAAAEHLYLSDMSGARAASVRLDAGLSGLPLFQTANEAGTEVYFTELSSANKSDLYVYRTTVGYPELIAENLPTNANRSVGTGTKPVLGLSGDGSWLYFVAEKAPAGVVGAAEGLPNLFVRHAGSTHLVGVLSREDGIDWAWDETNSQSTVRVSDNGWLAFMSNGPLTGYDNRALANARPAEEVYLYQGETGRLRCASCLSSGGRPVATEECENPERCQLIFGETLISQGIVRVSLSGVLPGSSSASQSRALTSEGRVFFDSIDALVPQDVNGTWDVYEWEPAGVGSCTPAAQGYSEASGGCVSLISSGRSSEESGFVDASESGGDVFFYTADRLVPADFDNNLDLYDAHACTAAVPCLPPSVVPPPVCRTEASCKAAPAPQPGLFGSPASATFSGPGNLASPAAVKAKAKPLTRAQKLSAALKTCKRDKQKAKRAGCEKTARKRFGPTKKSKKGGKR